MGCSCVVREKENKRRTTRAPYSRVESTPLSLPPSKRSTPFNGPRPVLECYETVFVLCHRSLSLCAIDNSSSTSINRGLKEKRRPTKKNMYSMMRGSLEKGVARAKNDKLPLDFLLFRRTEKNNGTFDVFIFFSHLFCCFSLFISLSGAEQ